MKKTQLFVLGTVLAFFLTTFVTAQTNIYVAPNGNDSNNGSIGSPLKTLIGARNKVRSIKSSGLPNGGIVVNFRAGRYPVTETCNMGSQDGGESGKPIIYRGYGNEKVIFDGAVYVDNNLFSKTTSSDASKLHSGAAGNVYYQTITNANLINLLKSTTAQMSMNDKMMTISRFPNIGFGHINQSTITPGYETIKQEGTFSNPKGARFKMIENFDKGKWAAEISRTKRVTARGYLSAQWHKETIPVASGTNGYIRLRDGTSYGVDRPKTKGDPNRMFVMQILCELDEPGEWYFDPMDNKLYVWPFEPISDESKIGVWAGPQMAKVENAKYINFERMVIQNIGKGSNGDGALNFRSGENYFVAGVTFQYIAEPVTACNFWQDVKNSKMQSCNFFDIWNCTRLYGGSFNSTGNIKNGNNRILNCHFTQIYSKDLYGKACGINGVRNVFRNNLIHNMNGQPITHAGLDHFIELNEAFNVGIEEGDGGAFYTGNDMMSYGNVLRHNFVHHIMSVPSLLGRAAFFSDDYDSGDLVEENVLYKGGWEAIKFNRGSGHSVYKNVVLDCYVGIKQSDGGSSNYNNCMQYINSTNGKTPTSNDKTNYIGRVLKKVGISGWQSGLSESNWNTRIEPFWTNRYPYFRDAMNAYANNNKTNAYQCRFYDNMFWSNNSNVSSGGTAAVLRNQSVNLGMFVNPNNLNFKFNSSKPSFAPNIPFDNIGLYADSYRCGVPKKNDYRRAVKQHFEHLACHTSDSYNPSTINGRLYYNTGKLVMSTVPCSDADAYRQTEFYFDLGTATSALWPNAHRLSNKTTPGLYGWTNTSNLKAVDRGTSGGANNLNRDFVYSSQPKTLEVNVPNGNYSVLITFGDVSHAHDKIMVKAEGVTKLSNINTTAGNNFFNRTFEVDVNDGKLSLQFSDQGGSDPNWVATRIVIKPAPTSLRSASLENEEVLASGFHLYPNPAKSELNVIIDNAVDDNTVLYIYNSMGSLVKVKSVTSNDIKLNIDDLDSGIYIVVVTNGETQRKKKFVKK